MTTTRITEPIGHHLHPVSRSAARRRLPAALMLTLAAVVGLVGGLTTWLLESTGDPSVLVAIHRLAPWTSITVVLGMVVPGRWRLATLAGLLSQVGLVIGYYVAKAELTWLPLDTAVLVQYSVVALLTGPVCGAAGALLRDRRPWVRMASLGLASAPWLVDALRMTMATMVLRTHVAEVLTTACCFVVIGVALPLVLGRSRRDWVGSLAVAVLACAVIELGLDVVLPRLL